VCVYVCVGVGVHVSIYAYCHVMGELYLCACTELLKISGTSVKLWTTQSYIPFCMQ
jgi:hypothetical protein